MTDLSLQEIHAPDGRCFGCGVANLSGLRIKSFPSGEQIIARWQGEERYEAFPGILNGGIVGSLLDCHSNWAAAYHLMQRDSLDALPSTVTAEYHVKLRRATPSNEALEIRAWATESTGSKVYVEAEIVANGEVCATCEGLFIAVKPGHPAFGRW